MYNRNDIPTLEKRIHAVLGSDGEAVSDAAQGIIDSITGPSTGLVYDKDERAIRLADGWIFDSSGNIVHRDSVTGPGA